MANPAIGREARRKTYFDELNPSVPADKGHGGRHPPDEPGEHGGDGCAGPAAGAIGARADVHDAARRHGHRGGFPVSHGKMDPAADHPADGFRQGDPERKPGPCRSRRIRRRDRPALRSVQRDDGVLAGIPTQRPGPAPANPAIHPAGVRQSPRGDRRAQPGGRGGGCDRGGGGRVRPEAESPRGGCPGSVDGQPVRGGPPEGPYDGTRGNGGRRAAVRPERGEVLSTESRADPRPGGRAGGRGPDPPRRDATAAAGREKERSGLGGLPPAEDSAHLDPHGDSPDAGGKGRRAFAQAGGPAGRGQRGRRAARTDHRRTTGHRPDRIREGPDGSPSRPADRPGGPGNRGVPPRGPRRRGVPGRRPAGDPAAGLGGSGPDRPCLRQPALERPEVHASRREGHPLREGGRGVRPVPGLRHGGGDPGEIPSPHLRTVLSRTRSGSGEGGGVGTCHREGHRGGARRDRRGGKPGGDGKHVPVHPAEDRPWRHGKETDMIDGIYLGIVIAAFGLCALFAHSLERM